MKWILIVALALMATSAAHAGKRTNPQKSGWYCEVTDAGVKFYKAKAIGTQRKRDAVWNELEENENETDDHVHAGA